MAFIGNNVQTQGFTPAIDYFSGNGVTVTFTLSRPVASVAQVIIAIDNVVQNSSTAYSVSGNSITFTSAPLSGTNNIWVQYTSPITTYAAISQDPSVIGDITATGGFLSTGDFGNTYTDGTIVDYVTGNARITTGPADGLTIYNGGTASRTALMAIDSSGNVGIGTSSPTQKLQVTANSNSLYVAPFVSGVDIQSTGSLNPHYQTNFDLYTGAIGSGTLRFRSDVSGRVTTPSQTAFYATANDSAFTGTVLPFGGTVFNVGSNFNTSTYTFTAPVTGIYLFNWQFFSPPNAAAVIDFQKNSTSIGRYGPEAGTITNYTGWSGSITLNLAANDTVRLIRFGGTIHLNPTYDYFTGYLLG